MKKILISMLLLLTTVVSVNAQILRTEELEKYAKEKYGDKWVDAATNLGKELTLDKNNALTYVHVISAEGKTKEQLYVLLNYWFTATFNDANSVIKLNDKELGTIIAQGYLSNVAQHTGGMRSYKVSVYTVIKCDIKDNKVRVTFTVPYYCVNIGAGGLAMISGGVASGLGRSVNTNSVQFDENWTLDTCVPFAAKDRHKKASSKALVMVHAYSNVLMDKIEECIKNGLVGNEGNAW